MNSYDSDSANNGNSDTDKSVDEMNNRRIHDEPETNFQNENKCLHITGIDTELSDDDLFNHFTDCGEIEKATVIRDPITKNSRGFGFLTFKNLDDAKFAVKTKDKSILGRGSLHVDFARRTTAYDRTPGRYMGHPQNARQSRYSSHRDQNPDNHRADERERFNNRPMERPYERFDDRRRNSRDRYNAPPPYYDRHYDIPHEDFRGRFYDMPRRSSSRDRERMRMRSFSRERVQYPPHRPSSRDRNRDGRW